MEIVIEGIADIKQTLDELLIDPETERIKLLPAEFYSTIPSLHLRVWCSLTARYLIPTQELVTALKAFIRDRHAIEIGSGNGDLYYHLGIQGTDSYIQQTDLVKAAYAIHRNAPTNPPSDVAKMDAIRAIEFYKPDLVIGAWITQEYRPSESHLTSTPSGPNEEEIIRRADYLHIGNWNVHRDKRILKFPHEICYLPGLVTRAKMQDYNSVTYWPKLNS